MALDGAERWSLVVLSADGDTVYADRADHAVAPASVLKLIVAATSLHDLGAQYRYHTILAAMHGIDEGGSIDGDLWLVGSGDPSFRSSDLNLGVADLARAGLKRVVGSVAVDATTLHGPEVNPHWDADDLSEDYAAPTSAASIDGDTVEFDVAGTTPGQAADVQVLPESDAISVTGEIATASADSGDDVTIVPGTTANSFKLSGTIGEGLRQRYWLPVHGIPQYAGAVLERLLAEYDVTVGLAPVVAPAPLDAMVLWDHRSAPLRALEAHMLFHSDNHYAEQLLRTVGEQSGGEGDGAGIAAERRFLSERGIPAPGLQVSDGSGLADSNRVAAITLARVLSDSETMGGSASLYLLLPLGGRQGTLRFYDFTTALGRVRAKSGHIEGVASLAGYVNTLHHGRVVFAFLFNGSPGDPDSAIVRAVNRLAQF
jgi:D-alanyl-D-alanine carboxypeptidase/D-alanyl-D-alanine-endopeptidase (penicillin-binding protein 4)